MSVSHCQSQEASAHTDTYTHTSTHEGGLSNKEKRLQSNNMFFLNSVIQKTNG